MFTGRGLTWAGDFVLGTITLLSTCYRRTRHDSTTCGGQRVDADAIEQAVTGLIEALVAQVKITGPGRIVPVFRIPQPEADSAAEAGRGFVH